MDKIFRLDELPVSFGERLPAFDDGRVDRRPLNDAMRRICELISTQGGFKLWHRRTEKGFKYVYFCSQNEQKIRRRPTSGKRDRVSVNKKFECHGRLNLRPCMESRSIKLCMFHNYHTPHIDITISSEISQFIADRSESSTPGEIFRDLKASKLPNAYNVSQKQVYYIWHSGQEKQWKRDDDQLKSASLLLSERNAENVILKSNNLHGIAIYCRETIERLSKCTKELAMNATYGTNNCGMNLFAVLAEVGGTGIPIGYCFVRVTKAVGDTRSRPNSGEWALVLSQFLTYFRDVGFRPTFFGTDKDFSEIEAIKRVWPDIKVQLCLWHAKRAISMKLKSSSNAQVNISYEPEEIAKIPDFEVCWAAIPKKRPDGPHQSGECRCPSRKMSFSDAGRLEPSTKEEIDFVLDMFSRHFNEHTLIPDRNGVFRQKDTIYWQSVSEAYQWCRQKDYPRLWAYLCVNWYRPERYNIWARAANPSEIPVLKTTMIVESHWRKLKHDYLHRFNRPRIDLVLFILLTRVIPDAVTRMNSLLESGGRSEPASWRKEFKRKWREHQRQEVTDAAIAQYHTNPVAGVCACVSFLQSRFLICKHVVNCFVPKEVGEKSAVFFNSVERRRTHPFWTHLEELELNAPFTHFRVLPEVNEDSDKAESEVSMDDEIEDDESRDNPDFEDESSEDGENEQLEDRISCEDEVQNDRELEVAHSVVSNVRWLHSIVQHQDDMSALKFLVSLAEERGFNDIISSLRADLAQPLKTWGPRRHKASLYYQ